MWCSTWASRRWSSRSCGDAPARTLDLLLGGSRGTAGSTCRRTVASSGRRSRLTRRCGRRLLPQEVDREADRDRRALARRARDLEPSTTVRRSLTHHRHPEVALRPRRGRVEPDAVVAEGEDDVVRLLAD